MFCPKCGSANQQKNSYCRNCGIFLPDFEKLKKSQTTPEQHLKANLVLNFLTAIASLTLAIWLYAYFLGREGTPVIIYATAGFLLAMFGWQIQIIIRTFLLKKYFRQRRDSAQTEPVVSEIEALKTNDLLVEADLSSVVPANLTEKTTHKLRNYYNE